MENWENKIIAGKLNSLKQLPEDYTPDLLSKWEIIEAGLPKEKRKIAPFYKLAAAASITGIIFFAGLFFFTEKKQPVALLLPFHPTLMPAFENQINKPINNITKPTLASAMKIKRPLPGNNSKTVLNETEHFAAITKTAAPILNNSDLNTASPPKPIASTILIANAKPETVKPAKAKVFQKDFTDEVLTLEKSSASQHAGFKIQFNKNDINTDQQLSPVVQWQKSF